MLPALALRSAWCGSVHTGRWSERDAELCDCMVLCTTSGAEADVIIARPQSSAHDLVQRVSACKDCSGHTAAIAPPQGDGSGSQVLTSWTRSRFGTSRYDFKYCQLCARMQIDTLRLGVIANRTHASSRTSPRAGMLRLMQAMDGEHDDVVPLTAQVTMRGVDAVRARARHRQPTRSEGPVSELAKLSHAVPCGTCAKSAAKIHMICT
jgi:hypothetical protein